MKKLQYRWGDILFFPFELLYRVCNKKEDKSFLQSRKKYLPALKVACYVLNYGKKGMDLAVPVKLYCVKGGRCDRKNRYAFLRKLKKYNPFSDVFRVLSYPKELYGFKCIYVLCLKDLSDFKGWMLFGFKKHIEKICSVRSAIVTFSHNKQTLRKVARELGIEGFDLVNLEIYFYRKKREPFRRKRKVKPAKRKIRWWKKEN